MDYTSVITMLSKTRFDTVKACLFFEDDADSIMEMPVQANMLVNNTDLSARIRRRDDYGLIVSPSRLQVTEIALKEHAPHPGSYREQLWSVGLDTKSAVGEWKNGLFSIDTTGLPDESQPMITISGLVNGIADLEAQDIKDDSINAVLGTFTGRTGSIDGVDTAGTTVSRVLKLGVISDLLWISANYSVLDLGCFRLTEFTGRAHFTDVVLTRDFVKFTLELKGSCDEFLEQRPDGTPLKLQDVTVQMQFTGSVRLKNHTDEWKDRTEIAEGHVIEAALQARKGSYSQQSPHSGPTIIELHDEVVVRLQMLQDTATVMPSSPKKTEFRVTGLQSISARNASIWKDAFVLDQSWRLTPSHPLETHDFSLRAQVLYSQTGREPDSTVEDNTSGTFQAAAIQLSDCMYDNLFLKCKFDLALLIVKDGSFGPEHFHLNFEIAAGSTSHMAFLPADQAGLDLNSPNLDASGFVALEYFEGGKHLIHCELLRLSGGPGTLKLSTPSFNGGDSSNPVRLTLGDPWELVGRHFQTVAWWESEEVFSQYTRSESLRLAISECSSVQPVDLSEIACMPTLQVFEAGLHCRNFQLVGSAFDGTLSGSVDIDRVSVTCTRLNGIAIPKITVLLGLHSTGAQLFEAQGVTIPLPQGAVLVNGATLDHAFSEGELDLDGPIISMKPGADNLLRVSTVDHSADPALSVRIRAPKSVWVSPSPEMPLDELQVGLHVRTYGAPFSESRRSLKDRILLQLAFTRQLIVPHVFENPPNADIEFCQVARPILEKIVETNPEAASNPYVAAAFIYCKMKESFPDLDAGALSLFSVDEFGVRLDPRDVSLEGIYEGLSDEQHVAVVLTGGTKRAGVYLKYSYGVDIGPLSEKRHEELDLLVDAQASIRIIARFSFGYNSSSGSAEVEPDEYYLWHPIQHLPPIPMSQLSEMAGEDEEGVKVAKNIMEGIFWIPEIQNWIKRSIEMPINLEALKNWNVWKPRLDLNIKENRVAAAVDAEQTNWVTL
ncbi:MAG: hypothetical protein RDU20_08660 [Desulfomonilaceae bacterium]|nr:hypothetical protein [Desulfomonilaceae bacterium]